MAKQWKCARCGTKNLEPTLTCANCRMIRGAVVVKSAQPTIPSWASPAAPGPSSETPSHTASTAPSELASAPAAEPTYWIQPGEAAPGRGRLRLVIPALFLVVGVVGAAIAVLLASPEAPEGVVAATGVQTLHVGECLDIANVSEEEVTGITTRPCNRDHEYEVIFTGSADGIGYPTDDAFDEYFASSCVPAFEAYIGEEWGTSPLDIFWLIPTREGWRQGDRSIQCLVYHTTVKRLTTSLKDAGRLRT